MIPMLARTVAPLDANWGPSHVHWAAVNALIKRDLHQDTDPLAAHAQSSLALSWQHALDQSLNDEDLRTLLRFFRSSLGKDYVEFQQRLSSIDRAAGADMLSRMTTGQSGNSANVQSSTPEQMAVRQRAQNLSLPLSLTRAQSGTAASAMLSKLVVTTRGDAIDALIARYNSELSDFENFNRSVAVSKVAAAGAVVAGAWPHDPAAQELRAALAAEPQKRAKEWQVAYAIPSDTAPQIPEQKVKAPNELEPGDTLFPVANPHPAHQLEIVGTLPNTIPVGDFQAIYATDITSKAKVSGPCQRYTNLGPKEFDQFTDPQALEVLETIAITPIGDHYRATVPVDRFESGQCNWHLREIRYRLYVKGFGYRLRDAGIGQIQVMDARHRAVEAAKGGLLYEGQLDIWCGKLLNRNISPYYPVGCGALDDFRPRVPPKIFAGVPALQKASHSLVYVSSEATSVQVNFHDVDALAALTP